MDSLGRSLSCEADAASASKNESELLVSSSELCWWWRLWWWWCVWEEEMGEEGLCDSGEEGDAGRPLRCLREAWTR